MNAELIAVAALEDYAMLPTLDERGPQCPTCKTCAGADPDPVRPERCKDRRIYLAFS